MSDFWAKVNKTETCWIWTASRTRGGYGQLFRKGKWHSAHRWAYRELVGEIPEGLGLDHLCRNRACVNPAHLEPVTHRTNVLRGESPWALNAAKTHCKRGHAFTPDNIYIQPGRSHRSCRICRAMTVVACRARRREARIATGAA